MAVFVQAIASRGVATFDCVRSLRTNVCTVFEFSGQVFCAQAKVLVVSCHTSKCLLSSGEAPQFPGAARASAYRSKTLQSPNVLKGDCPKQRLRLLSIQARGRVARKKQRCKCPNFPDPVRTRHRQPPDYV